jgi:hypothetical protein
MWSLWNPEYCWKQTVMILTTLWLNSYLVKWYPSLGHYILKRKCWSAISPSSLSDTRQHCTSQHPIRLPALMSLISRPSIPSPSISFSYHPCYPSRDTSLHLYHQSSRKLQACALFNSSLADQSQLCLSLESQHFFRNWPHDEIPIVIPAILLRPNIPVNTLTGDPGVSLSVRRPTLSSFYHGIHSGKAMPRSLPKLIDQESWVKFNDQNQYEP